MHPLLNTTTGRRIQRRLTTRVRDLKQRFASSDDRQSPSPLPPPRLEPGAAKATMFFDDYPRFYETSSTGAVRRRLNLRYEAIINHNRDIFQGARVLDIASHDGRWSLAALKAGASHATGIEARQELVDNARDNLTHYGIESDRFQFIAGDVFEVLANEKLDVDVVMCLGFMYHTLRYPELLRYVRDLNPRHLIIDTGIIKSKEADIRVRAENVVPESNAAPDSYAHGGHVLVGRPSRVALRRMLAMYDFEIERFADWAALLRDNAHFGDIANYSDGTRVTLRCRSTQ